MGIWRQISSKQRSNEAALTGTCENKDWHCLRGRALRHSGFEDMRKLFLFSALCAALIGPSRAHDYDHASDWIGDRELKNANNVPCCGKADCAELQDDAVTEAAGGYRVDGWAYYHAYSFTISNYRGSQQTVQVQSHWAWIRDFVAKDETLPSQDQHYWRCESHGGRICFLVPPRDF